jgi:hypothetical protein
MKKTLITGVLLEFDKNINGTMVSKNAFDIKSFGRGCGKTYHFKKTLDDHGKNNR